MKILVTGGAGFIASHVADTYIEAGHKVVIVDNLLTGFRRNVNPKAKFYKADIRDRAAMDAHLQKRKTRDREPSRSNRRSREIHPRPDPDTPDERPRHNERSRCIRYVRPRAKIKNSSSPRLAERFVPPEGTRIPLKESEATIALSPYGLSKQLGEEIIKFYSQQFGFNYLIFRYPNVYGPRQNPKGEAGVTAIFGGTHESRKQPIIFGDGTKARDYVYIDDIARANLIALRKGNHETISLGWGKLVTDQMIFDAMAKAVAFRGNRSTPLIGKVKYIKWRSTPRRQKKSSAGSRR